MSVALLYAAAGCLLFALGVGGTILHVHLVRKVISVNVAGSGTFLVIVGLGQRAGVPDPVPQALVLTGIVVAVAATGCALALARRLCAATGRCELPGERAGEQAGERAAERAGSGAPPGTAGRTDAPAPGASPGAAGTTRR